MKIKTFTNLRMNTFVAELTAQDVRDCKPTMGEMRELIDDTVQFLKQHPMTSERGLLVGKNLDVLHSEFLLMPHCSL